jgi:gamma-glutamyltranspeptidase/glutathione hydrolase
MAGRGTGRPTTWATNGVVASPHYLASQAGLRVLQEGGNAVDAAIATNAVLNVVYSHQCHIGGDLFAMVWDPKDRQLHGLNSSGTAPAAMSVDWMRAQGHTVMPPRGALTVTVPGTVAGWAALSERFGSRGLDAVLTPAATYARDGVPMPRDFVNATIRLRSVLEANDAAASTLLDKVSRPGDCMAQPGLAATFERVGREGRDGFYRGEVADDIVTTLTALGSPITHDDLSGFTPEWVTPLSTTYRGFDLYELPPNTQGPTALLMANIAEGLPTTDLGHTTGAGIHAWVETKLRAFAERDRHIADPRFADVPLDRFLSKDHAARLRATIDLERTSDLSGQYDDGDTIYLCVVDRDGMAVSLIQSVYNNFGSGVVAERSGILFHNRGLGFSLDPSHANALAGGKRPYHTLIPGMLFKDGDPWMVFGTMGADAQAQIHLQLLLGFVDFELEPQTAIETPRWVSGADPDGTRWLRVEPRAGQDVLADLAQRGHNVIPGEDWDSSCGHAHCIRIDHERGILGGASDPRSDGAAVGT